MIPQGQNNCHLWVDGLVKTEPGKWTSAALTVVQGEVSCTRHGVHNTELFKRVQWPGKTKTRGNIKVNIQGETLQPTMF